MSKKLSLAILLILILSGSSIAMPEMPPTMVNTALARLENWQPEVEATGSLVAQQGVTLKSEIQGRVEKILFNSGDQVKAGTLLVQLNSDSIRAQLALNQANFNLAKAQYDRRSSLLDKKVVSQSEMDEAFATLKVNEALVQQAKAQLDKTQIRAPFSGRLGIRKIDLGDVMNSGDIIVNLETIDPIYIDFNLPVIYLSQLEKNQKVIVSSESYPNEEFQGYVSAAESKVDSNSQSLKVRAQISNKGGRLIPGTFMHVRLLVGKASQVLLVPQTAVLYSTEGPFVYKLMNGKAVKSPITVSKQTANSIVVSAGLSAGEKIITDGNSKLFDGAPALEKPASPPPTEKK